MLLSLFWLILAPALTVDLERINREALEHLNNIRTDPKGQADKVAQIYKVDEDGKMKSWKRTFSQAGKDIKNTVDWLKE